jgi:hypothetical protein
MIPVRCKKHNIYDLYMLYYTARRRLQRPLIPVLIPISLQCPRPAVPSGDMHMGRDPLKLALLSAWTAAGGLFVVGGAGYALTGNISRYLDHMHALSVVILLLTGFTLLVYTIFRLRAWLDRRHRERIGMNREFVELKRSVEEIRNRVERIEGSQEERGG